MANSRKLISWGAVDEALKRVDPESPDFSCEKFLGALDEPVRTYVRNFVEGFDAADPAADQRAGLAHRRAGGE